MKAPLFTFGLVEGIFCLIVYLHLSGLKPSTQDTSKNICARFFSLAMLSWSIRGFIMALFTSQIAPDNSLFMRHLAPEQYPYLAFAQYEVFILFSIISNIFLIKGIATSDYVPTQLQLQRLLEPKWTLFSFILLLTAESLIGIFSIKEEGFFNEAYLVDILISSIAIAILIIVAFKSFVGRSYNHSSLASCISLILILASKLLYLPMLKQFGVEVVGSNIDHIINPAGIYLSLFSEALIGLVLFSLINSQENLEADSLQVKSSRIKLYYTNGTNSRPYKVDLFIPGNVVHQDKSQLTKRPFVALLALCIVAHLPDSLEGEEGNCITLPTQYKYDDTVSSNKEKNYLGSYSNIKRLRESLGIVDLGILIKNWNAKQYSININPQNITFDPSLLEDGSLHPELRHILIQIIADQHGPFQQMG